MEQTIRFCKSPDGVRIAYATAGSGYPLVVCPGWLSHLELDWAAPFHRAFWEQLGERYSIIRYDRRGVGLSDRNVEDYSLEAQVGDLAAVIEATGEKKVALLGHCTGGSLVMTYTAEHPNQVSHLVLCGTFASGKSVTISKLAEALFRLIDADWGGVGSLAMADMFFPGAPLEQREAYVEYQVRCASREAALAQARTIYSFGATDLKDIQVPAVVLHQRDDKIAPFELGRRLSSDLPNCRLVPLEGDSNVLGIGSEQTISETVAAILDLLADAGGERVPSANGVTRREGEVLQLVASGKSNRAIADDLCISINTVDRHVSNIFTKIGAANRAEAASYAVRNGLA